MNSSQKNGPTKPSGSGSKGNFLVLISCVIMVLLFQLSSLAQLTNDNTAAMQPRSSSRTPKLGDGCYHVFLDVGSNIGIHARFLFEPDRYPDSKKSVPAFAREFGYPRDNRDYCVFSFEPSPKFEKRHLDLQKAYNAMGWRYTPIIAGASNSDGNLTFYHSWFKDEEWETGFSAVTPITLYGTNATARTVKIVRLASWIQREIQDREIPNKPSTANFLDGGDGKLSEPKVIMKLDIEGLEFKVFPDLLTSGALCNNIHYLMGEFHHGPGNHNYYPINVTSDGRHVLQHRKQGEQMAKQLLHIPDISENCMTRISLEDDESYLTDPFELPELNKTTTVSS
ncbi:hypothetical protein ACHAXR_007998 [Thalassiosira sp. AJA248-18]